MLEMYEYGIGRTPMQELPAVHGNRMFVKTEGSNFLGSIKARSAYFMVKMLPEAAEGKVIVESTSGNLGMALGFFCRETGREFLALVDPTISARKLEHLRDAGIAYHVVQSEDGLDFRSSRVRMAERMAASGRYHWINQYHNSANVLAHEITTGPEILEQTEGKVTHVICAMGSCGTICGLGRFFHRCAPYVRVIGVEPYGSTIRGKISGDYLNVGAGYAGPTENLKEQPDAVDEAFTVLDADAISASNELWNDFQLSVGITTGMAYFQAKRIAEEQRDSCIVFLSPDKRGEYLAYL